MKTMSPVDQVIKSLNDNPDEWYQCDHTIRRNKSPFIAIWTSNMPYLDCALYEPKIKTGLIDRIRLQIAVNKWSKIVDLKINTTN